MRELHIRQNDANQRVDKFLTKALPTLPQNLLYKYIRNKKIKVNKARCEISQRLVEGDILQLYIAEEFFDQPRDMKFLKATSDLAVMYEDKHVLVVDKPIGLLAHSDQNQFEDNLIDRIKHYLYDKKEFDPEHEHSFSPSLCHRIDRNTQGIVIAAKDAQTLRLMNEKIHDHALEKRYLCIVEGHMPKTNDMVILYHKKDQQQNIADIVDKEKEGYKEIQTGYCVLQKGQNHDLLEVELYSGKSHQIRATMAYLQHPLLSDVKYGARKTEFGYQALCAYQVLFHFEKEDHLFYLNETCIQIQKPYIKQYFYDKKL